MPALLSLAQRLHPFRFLCARPLPGVTCCVGILGFRGSSHLEALPSLCRCWHMAALGSPRL